MPRGRGAQPRPASRPQAAGRTKKPFFPRRRNDSNINLKKNDYYSSDGDGDDDDKPGPADKFYEADDGLAPEDAGGASARRFDVRLFCFF